MNVALISTLYAPEIVGGAERVTQDLAEALAAEGHGVSVICLASKPQAEFALRNGVRVHYCRLKNLYWPFPVARAAYGKKVLWHLIDTYNPAMERVVGRLLDEIGPEVVHTHGIAGFSVAAWSAIKARRLPLVHTLHDHYLLCPYSTMFKDGENCRSRCFGCRLVSLPRGRMARLVDVVVGVSRYILQRHLELGFFAGASRAVVYSGYQPEGSVGAPGGGPPPLRIGFLGRLDPIKGLHRLVDAFLDLPAGAAELWIAGAGDTDYETSMRSRTAARSDVRWLGPVAPEAFLADVHLLVAPSLVNEAMGRVIVEAYAHGVPVVGSDRGGLPELVDSECGWIVDPDKRGALAAVLQHCVERPERLRAMRCAALAAARRFSRQAMANGYLAAYRQAIERTAQAPPQRGSA